MAYGHYRKLLRKRKAVKIIEVLKETGDIDLIEAHRRMYPNMSEVSHSSNAKDMLKDGAMDEVERLLKIRDKDLLKRLTPEVIVQDIVDDLQKLNELRDSGKVSTEEIIKIINGKTNKQKLLGLAIGAWRASLSPDKADSADDLIRELTKLGEGKNEI